MPKEFDKADITVRYSKIIGFVNVEHRGRIVLVIPDRCVPKKVLEDTVSIREWVLANWHQELCDGIRRYVSAEEWGYKEESK